MAGLIVKKSGGHGFCFDVRLLWGVVYCRSVAG